MRTVHVDAACVTYCGCGEEDSGAKAELGSLVPAENGVWLVELVESFANSPREVVVDAWEQASFEHAEHPSHAFKTAKMLAASKRRHRKMLGG